MESCYIYFLNPHLLEIPTSIYGYGWVCFKILQLKKARGIGINENKRMSLFVEIG